jgi:hypothetical protein
MVFESAWLRECFVEFGCEVVETIVSDDLEECDSK